jgi:hypothetical protein
MTVGHSPLVEAFLDDHKRMTRLIARLHEALGQEDAGVVRALAEELDRVAGPHIEFEEQVLYPLVARERDAAYARQLYAEHSAVRDALAQLLAKERLDEAEAARLKAGIGVGLEHAASCGTLVSHLGALPEKEQEQALATLVELQRKARNWTDLSERTVPGKDGG